MDNKSSYVLEMEGFERIEYTDMLERIVAGEEILLTTNGDKLYWKPSVPDVQELS